MRCPLALTGISKLLKQLSQRLAIKPLGSKLALASSALVLGGCSSLSALFFYPQSQLIATPREAGLAYQDVWLTAADDTQLHAWWLPAQGEQPDSNVMLLYVHGNAENISSHSRSIYWLPKQGVSVLALDYRGFGASQGKARLPAMLQDLAAAALWMKQQHPDKELMILGQSIGTVLAINFAAQAAEQYAVQGLILDAPILGIPSAARYALGKNPVGLLIWPFTVLLPSQWDPKRHIQHINLPVLMMHSPADAVVSYQQAKKLYEYWQAAHPQQQLCWVDSQGPHIASFAFPELRQATLDFIHNKRCQAW